MPAGRLKEKSGLFLVFITLVFVSLGCEQSDPVEFTEESSHYIKPPELVKGFGISPRGHPLTHDKFGEFLEEVSSFGNGGVLFNASWRDDIIGGSSAGKIPEGANTIAVQSKIYDFTPIFVFGWRSGDEVFLGVTENPTNDWGNLEARALFSQMVVEFAKTYRPPFIFLANENSYYYEHDRSDYYNFIDFYDEAYTAIKAVSPETMVGVVFNYEHIAGRGGFNQWDTPYWEALTAHDLARMDVVGVTLYPFLNYATPEEVPDFYLDELINKIGDIPIAITETGWPGDYDEDVALAWEASDRAQVEFVNKLEGILSGKNVVVINWLFLHSFQRSEEYEMEWKTFGSISLYDDNGQKRPVYDLWWNFSPIK